MEDKPEQGKLYALTGSSAGNSIAQGKSWAESEVKKWKVLVSRYPLEYEVEATTEEEAKEKGKKLFAEETNHASVWECEAGEA